MKKPLLLILLVGLFLNLNATDTKKVAYITLQKDMDATATTVQNDPIIQVLSADDNLSVTVKVVEADATISDLSDYDVIIVQESFGSGSSILTPDGSLALKSIPKPFIYNKSYGLRSGKALTTASSAAAESDALSYTVESSALSNDLFKACTIGSSNEITVMNSTTDDTGAEGTKSLNYNTGNVLSASSTLLAQPTGVTDAVICINDFPAGTTIDSETLASRMITIGMNFGAICATSGANLTDDGLTIWRNAVYILAGLDVPSTKASLSSSSIQSASTDNLEVVSTAYYTLNGTLVKEPQKSGIYIKKSTYENGSSKFDKVVITK